MTKNKWLGAFLNFLVPGLGSFYVRNIRKGIVVYILFLIIVLGWKFISYTFVLFLVSLILIVGYYVYVIIDGYRGVREDKIYEPVYFDRWFMYITIIVLHSLVTDAIRSRALATFTPINFAGIPTPAMDPTLLVGDKLAYKNTKAIGRNDVTIFWFPENPQTMYIKRCIGLPGDSLRIRNSTVLINGAPLKSVPFKFSHRVITTGSNLNSKVLEKSRIGEDDYYMESHDSYRIYLTEEQAKDLSTLPFIKKVELLTATEGNREAMIYPKSENLDWNTDFFGPIYIPKKGDRIKLTDKNIDLYFKCIEFENESVKRDSSRLMVNGQSTRTYEFKENYYFMMGDNRHNSLDSRYWGFLPEELVIGKALYVYWGKTNDRMGKEVK